MIQNLSGLALLLSNSFELSLVAKATLIVLGGLTVTAVARTARASARHLVVAASFAALAALPMMIAIVPAMPIDVPVTTASTTSARADSGDRTIADTSASTAAGVVTKAAQRALPGVSLAQGLRLAWIVGAIFFLIPVASVLWRLSMIRRTGLPVAWHRAELARLADARGVSLPVELLEHEAVPGPMTFGIRRPVIVLPLDAREWSEAELRRALMHEIEHIQRGDWLMQIVARTVAAVYWFHPLVWMAWRRLGLEAERSCDDAVVMTEDSTDYAEQLVLLAQRMSATPAQPMLGMANRSDLSTRVTAVLDDRMRRGRAGFALAAGTVAAAALVVLSVAPVRAVARAESAVLAAQSERPAPAPQQRKTRQSAPRKSRALDRELYEAATDGDFAGVKELVEAGANPSAKIEGDGSPLIGAARSGRSEITRFLLDQGADPNGVVEGDGSPLIQAAANGRVDQVQLLIDRGADVNLAVEGDENPLMNAAEHGNLRIVQLLVEKGADVNARIYSDRYPNGGEWRTAISQARKNGHTDVVRYLESRGAR
ncbi:MAG TPA: M56 family metallopeptidase [Vicinamibacterales bacterium]|nr:M56 family metallopeptidase [Vicinamibacterales bacterium]